MARQPYPYINQLYQTILKLETVEECHAFFDDLCTVNEVQSMAVRWEVARLLREKVTYNDIAERTGASTATISRVNRCLHYGADGYTTMLKRMDEKNGSIGTE